MELTYRKIMENGKDYDVFLKNVRIWSIRYIPDRDKYYIESGGKGFINLLYFGTGFTVDFLEDRSIHDSLEDALTASHSILEDYIKFLSE